MHDQIRRLCKQLGYEFNNPAYLKRALTHCSAGILNNERLEFLGDSILSSVIAHALFERFPEHTEGQLSRLRSHLVKGEMLALLAQDINLGDYLFLGPGELKSGGFRRASILADALEAVFAAIFLDGGFEVAKRVILHLFQSKLEDPALQSTLIDAKTQLQEYLQAQKLPLPIYTLNKILGEEHEQLFCVTCDVLKPKNTAQGQGDTRRKAEQEAARLLLDQLKTK